jgi:hypothetical protein
MPIIILVDIENLFIKQYQNACLNKNRIQLFNHQFIVHDSGFTGKV